MEVVGHLRKDTCPVNAVDGCESVSTVDLRIGEKSLDDVLRELALSSNRSFRSTNLAVVEGSLNGDVVHVGIKDGSHLSLLNGADLALGVHNENADILLTAQTVDSCRASVTTGCADHGQVFSILARLILALVPANQEVLEKVAQELQSNILESESWAVEQLKQVEVLLLVESCDGDNVVGAECSIALSDDFLQVGFRDLFA